jgi:hypothetical protein
MQDLSDVSQKLALHRVSVRGATCVVVILSTYLHLEPSIVYTDHNTTSSALSTLRSTKNLTTQHSSHPKRH